MFSKKHSRYFKLSFQITLINAGAILIAFFAFFFIIRYEYVKNEKQLARDTLTLMWKTAQKHEGSVSSIVNIYNKNRHISDELYGMRVANADNVTLFLDYPDAWNKYSVWLGDFSIDRTLDVPYRLKIIHNNNNYYKTNLDVYTLYVKGYYIQIIISVAERVHLLNYTIKVALLIFIIIALSSFIIANVVISRVLNPLTNINSLVEKIVKNKIMNQRLPETRRGEFDRLEKNFNIMLDVIERQMDRLKQATINIGHDIRTPLTRIRNQMESMLLDKREQQGENFDEKIEQCITFIDETKLLAKHILDLSEIESGLVYIPEKAVSIETALSSIVEIYTMLAEEKNITLITHIEKDISIFIDTIRLRQMVGNLLDNAVKFTDEDKCITLSIYGHNHNVFFEVKDEGIGIEKSNVSHIFNQSWTFNQNDEKYISGSGFGLAIVESIVTAYGGVIDVDSEVGKGTTFTIRFAH